MQKRLLFLIIFLIMVTSISSVTLYSFIDEINTQRKYKTMIIELDENTELIKKDMTDIDIKYSELKSEKAHEVEEYAVWEEINQKILENLK